jgi:hypothetical protein
MVAIWRRIARSRLPAAMSRIRAARRGTTTPIQSRDDAENARHGQAALSPPSALRCFRSLPREAASSPPPPWSSVLRRMGYRSTMDDSQNKAGTRLTCSNPACGCELQINVPCPHGSAYTCACGRPMEPVSR